MAVTRVNIASEPRMATAETELVDHESRLDGLEAAPPGGAPIPEAGVVDLQSFAGANDDAKFTAALSYAYAQTRIPFIRFGLDTTLNQGGRVITSGMKLLGPGRGFMNLELSSGKFVNHRVMLGSGITTGTNSLFVGAAANVYDINVIGLAFQSNRTAQFWSQPAGTLYSCTFRDLDFFGMKSVFGNPTQICAITWTHFEGNWSVHGFTGADTQFNIGGSDGCLWMHGALNIGGGAGTGAYMFYMGTMNKTEVGKVFFTCENGWRGLHIQGNPEGLSFFGGAYEGRNGSTPCHGTVLRIDNGQINMYGPWLAYGMGAPTTLGGGNNGVMEVRGGNVNINGISYARTVGQAESVPMIYQSGGRLIVREVHKCVATGSAWTGVPRIQSVGGTLVATDGTWTT